MLSVDQAFTKFKSHLELTAGEQRDAASRQRRIREVVCNALDVERDFLTGSYVRHTKTKPLKDVDIFIVLGGDEVHYADEAPDRVLEAVREVLAHEYGGHRVVMQRRSVRVDFGVTVVGDLSGQVMSFDVVPALSTGGFYVIPDRISWGWMPTDPEVHATKATEANRLFQGQWKPLVKMIKKWNDHDSGPVKPSFLIEVMSLDLLSDWGGSYSRELKAWFATAIDAIQESWEDPAGLGHPVSDRMASDPGLRAVAQDALRRAEATCTEALNHERNGRTGAALDAWQRLFGPAFAKS